MASNNLDNTQDRQAHFIEGIRFILPFWQQKINEQNSVTALDQSWPNIVKSLGFALDARICEATVYAIVESLAPHMERRGHWSEWHHILIKAFTVAECNNDLEAMSKLSALLGRLFRRQSQYRESVKYYRRAIRLSRQIGDKYNAGRACSNLGYYFIEHGQWHRAEVLCCHALWLFEQIDSAHGLAHTHNHLGILYTKRGAWPEAEHHLTVACKIWEEMRDQAGLMQGYINLGCLFSKEEFTDSPMPRDALTYFEIAMQYAQQAGDEYSIGQIYVNQGIAYQIRQKYNDAERAYRNAEIIFKRQANLLCLAQVYDNFGLIHIDQTEPRKASQYLDKALRIWQGLKNRYGTIRTLLYLATNSIAIKDKEESMSWLKQAEAYLYDQSQTAQYQLLLDQLDELRSRVIAEC